MPYPSQVTRDSLIQTAAALIESHGAEHVSLNAVAAALGVKAPSLYRYFDHKTALLQAVNQQTAQRLNDALVAGMADHPTPKMRLMAMFTAYRDFAKAHPSLYHLAYLSGNSDLHVGQAEAERLGIAMQSVVAAVVGEARALPVLRAAWAMAHGFVALELAGLFEREGGTGLDAAYDEAVGLFVEGIHAGMPHHDR